MLDCCEFSGWRWKTGGYDPNMRFRFPRSLVLPALALGSVAQVLAASHASARELQVSASFPCPDPTVCSCPDPAGDCFRFITIGEAMTAAAGGDSILVAAGIYAESVTLKSGVALLGGYDTSFTSSDPQANPTNISGGGLNPAIFSPPGMSSSTIVSGFILSNGGGTPGAGVVIQGGAPVFRDNVIIDTVMNGIAGGVYIFGGSSATIDDNFIGNNSTQGSGGGIRSDFSSPSLTRNTIENNTALHSGGGIHIVGGNPTITENRMIENHSGDGGGGGLHLQNVTLSNAVADNDFIDNDGIYGGGVAVKDESIVSFSGNDFTGNIARLSGGGISIIGHSEVMLTANRFTNCVAETSYGGGLYALDSDIDCVGTDATSASPDALFSGCTATLNGGGFYALNCQGLINSVRAQNCTADSAGGGIFVAQSLFTMTKNLVVDCTALEGGGVGIWYNGTIRQSLFYSNTIYGCTGLGAESGGGMTVFGNGQDNVADITGNIISHTRQGSALRCKRAPPGPAQTARPTIGCSTFHLDPSNPTIPDDTLGGERCQESFSTDGTNRIGDPLYCNALGGNFALQDCSPEVGASCIPAGKPGVDDRGVPYPGHCPCGIFSVEASSWGKIKASYR
jgi:parallel beta-helix repeat protein